jgi:hypothetical protein
MTQSPISASSYKPPKAPRWGTSARLKHWFKSTQSAGENSLRFTKASKKVAGHAPRAHGQVGRLPYIIDIGPRVRAWAVRNIKPKED